MNGPNRTGPVRFVVGRYILPERSRNVVINDRQKSTPRINTTKQPGSVESDESVTQGIPVVPITNWKKAGPINLDCCRGRKWDYFCSAVDGVVDGSWR